MQSRPFGVAFLVAGCDEHGPVLYHTDPSGTYLRFEAWAIGAGSEGAQSLLQERYSADMSLKDAEVLALNTLKQVRMRASDCCCGLLCCASKLPREPRALTRMPSLTCLPSGAPRCASCEAGAGRRRCLQVMEEKANDINVDVATVRPQEGFKLYSQAEVAELIARL